MASKIDPTTIDFYPFAYALYNEFLSEYCWYCLDEERKHLRCSACSVAIFCNKECQQLAWKDHKFECKALKKCTQVPDIEVRLLGRIVVRHKAISSGNAKEDPTFYKDRHSRRNVMDVWAHTKNIRNDPYAMQKFTDIYARLIQFYDSKALLPKDVIFELHCRDFINRHAISDKAYLKEIGKGLYCDLCAYDHSCKPNTIYTCNGFVATLRPLNANVNLLDRSTTFYSYIDLLCAKQARRKLLKDTWYFQCDCERCVDNSEHVLTSVYCPQCKAKTVSSVLCLFGNKEYKDMESQLIQCPECNETLSKEEVMQALAGMRFIDDLLDKTNFDEMGRSVAIDFLKDLLLKFENMLPKVNIYYCRLIQALIPIIDPADHEQLLQLHLDAEECVRICYPPNHPALAFHLRNIGIFYKSLRQFAMAAKYLSQAHEAFQFVMTPQHQLAHSTTSMLLEVNKAMENNTNSTNNGEEASDRNPEFAICEDNPCKLLEVHDDDKTEVDKRSSTINTKEGITNADQIFLSVTNCENRDMKNADMEDKQEKIEEVPAMVVSKFEETIAKSNSTNLLVTPEENISGSLLCIKIGENTTSVEPNLKISPSSLSESSGVKKKASLKKVAPRARTPLPPREIGKSDLAYIEDDPSNDVENEAKCNSLLETPKSVETLGQTQETKLCIEPAEKITVISRSDVLLKANKDDKSTKKSKRKNKKH
ncbi:MYND finger domain-containing protein [Ditylenchus destructor]|nr:MYND finger domain-containing protein [Ditylenchus destructor]